MHIKTLRGTMKKLLFIALFFSILNATQHAENITTDSPFSAQARIPSPPMLDPSFLDNCFTTASEVSYKNKIEAQNPNHTNIWQRKLWSLDFFNQKNLPTVVGQLKDPQTFSTFYNNKGFRFLDLPIYMPEQGWRIPPELAQFKEVIQMAVEHERLCRPNFEKDHYVYITVDQGLVKPKKSQRRSGWHSDSYRKINTDTCPTNILTDHVYVISDSCPTLFIEGPTPLDRIDPQDIDQVLTAFNDYGKKQTTITYPNHTLLRLDPYCIHDAGQNKRPETLMRTFVKISFSTIKYCHLGNAFNYLFRYNWPMVPRQHVPYTKEALSLSSHHKDRNLYISIDPREIDFINNKSNVPWAKPKILKAIKKGLIYAEPAIEGEMAETKNATFLITINVAEKGDYKVQFADGDIGFVSEKRFHANYTPDPLHQNWYFPQKTIRYAVELTRDVCMHAPWGTLQYAKAGDYLVYVNIEDIYLVPRKLFKSTYSILDPSINLYEKIIADTKRHLDHLNRVGLGERAKKIKVYPYKCINNLNNIDLTPFNAHMEIPQEAINFNPHIKNTIITTDPSVSYNKPEDIERILDIRLYPVLRNLIRQNFIEIFLGTQAEMEAYYQSKDIEVLYTFEVPSSVLYYLARKNDGDHFIIMSNLSSRENVTAQLITLKLAGIPIEPIDIIGTEEHFSLLVEKDMQQLLEQIPALKVGNHILIIAGCGLRDKVADCIFNKFKHAINHAKEFTGSIVSLTHIPLHQPRNNISGFISLDLNYGEITEIITQSLLSQCNCTHVFTGSAGGYIPHDPIEEKPSIGIRIPVLHCINEKGETTTLNIDDKKSRFHLQISSIFLETYQWLEKAKQYGSSVDVETFYIMRAIQKYNEQHPINPVQADCGYFVSDYVGEKPLREYSNVYKDYDQILSDYLDKILHTSKMQQ